MLIPTEKEPVRCTQSPFTINDWKGTLLISTNVEYSLFIGCFHGSPSICIYASFHSPPLISNRIAAAWIITGKRIWMFKSSTDRNELVLLFFLGKGEGITEKFKNHTWAICFAEISSTITNEACHPCFNPNISRRPSSACASTNPL